jgi:hypothetical protein
MAEQLGLSYHYAAEPLTNVVEPKINFSVLPQSMLGELGLAAAALDLNAARDIVKRIREINPALATQLNELVQGFRFDKIGDLCQAAKKT